MSIRKIQGFYAYLSVVFLNAFTDLGHKITIQNTVFKVYDGSEQIFLTALVNGLILLPFILLFTPSGFLSDKYPKHLVMRYSAWLAVVITTLITLCYHLGLFWPAFALTLVLAMQSALYAPAKYGYIKELFGSKHITSANGAVQSVTVVAILSGILFYSIGFEFLLQKYDSYFATQVLQDIAFLGWFLIFGSLVELYLSYKLPNKSNPQPHLEFDRYKYFKGIYLKRNLKMIYTNKTIWYCIIGLSTIWAISQVALAVYGSFAKESLGIENAAVVQAMMALSGVGIVFGSLTSGFVSKNGIQKGVIPLGAIGATATVAMIPNVSSIIAQGLNFLAFGFFAGLFIVPLNAIIQETTKQRRLGVTIAGNNFIQNIAMFTFLLVTMFVSLFEVDAVIILYILFLIGVVGTMFSLKLLSQQAFTVVISLLTSIRYRVESLGLHNLPKEKGVLLLGNHVSFLDWIFVAMASPRKIRFVMERSIYNRWYWRWFFDFFDVLTISNRAGKDSIVQLNQALQNGDVACIFPEGMITRNGNLGELKRGFELVASDVDGVIVPFYIDGMWGAQYSRSHTRFVEKNSKHWRTHVSVHFGEPLDINSKVKQVRNGILNTSYETWKHKIKKSATLDRQWLESVKHHGRKSAIRDTSGTEFSYYKAFALSAEFAKIFQKHKEQNIGLLMPTTSVGAILNLSVLMSGKTVVNLNYTASKDIVLSSIQQAEIKKVYTAKKFVSKLKSKGVDIQEYLQDEVELVYLEDLKENISKASFIWTLVQVSLLPVGILDKKFLSSHKQIDAPATILFSSGSEGKPKGVALSHYNISANVQQAIELVNPKKDDKILSSLPMFHAFGLTVTTFLPLLKGIPSIAHPDPTDSVGIGKAVYKYKATVMCATSTFLRLYTKNKRVHAQMFEPLRLVIAGAEKLSPNVANEFRMKFLKDILEGYGATEASPVISCNLPNALSSEYWDMQVGKKPGSVGMPLGGILAKIVDPNTYEELESSHEGLLLVTGPNVMERYLNDPEKTNEAFVELEGKRWYKTGDKAKIDSQGFITIVDRYSRFAKIGGEMVSLGMIENSLYDVVDDEDVTLVATNIADEKKGEKIVVLMDKEIDNIKQKIAQSPLSKLYHPSEIVISDIPILGSGKINFKEVKEKIMQYL